MPLKFANNQSLTSTTALPTAVPTDNLILISTQTASNSANISFTGINGTYDEYIFKFIDIHPRTNDVNFIFNFSTDNGSNYNVTKTTTFFRAYHAENDSTTSLGYESGRDIAQGTGFVELSSANGTDADKSLVGLFTLFNPSSTTYVKHFISVTQHMTENGNELTMNNYSAGYANTTSAVNAIQFKMSSGNMDGIIKLYGVKKS
jgi:hypothetical protein